MIGITPANDPELKGIGISVLSIIFEIFGENKPKCAPVRVNHGHIHLLLETAYNGSQGRPLVRPGPPELQAGKAAAVHEASAAGGVQAVIKMQRLHGTEIHKCVVADPLKKTRQGQFRDIPVVPVTGLRAAEDAQFLSFRGRCSCGKRMILQRSDRQAEKLVRQDGFFIACQRTQDGDAVIVPPYIESPVCQSADRFQVILLPCDISLLLYLFFSFFTIETVENHPAAEILSCH